MDVACCSIGFPFLVLNPAIVQGLQELNALIDDAICLKQQMLSIKARPKSMGQGPIGVRQPQPASAVVRATSRHAESVGVLVDLSDLGVAHHSLDREAHGVAATACTPITGRVWSRVASAVLNPAPGSPTIRSPGMQRFSKYNSVVDEPLIPSLRSLGPMENPRRRCGQ